MTVQQASLSFRDAVDHLDIPKFIRLGNQVDPNPHHLGILNPRFRGFTEGFRIEIHRNQ